MRKNVASQVIGAQLNSKTDGSAVTTGTTTVYVTGDGGTQAAGSVGSGACTHEGQGYWTYAPSQAETNYDQIAFTFVNTSAVTATVQVYPAYPQTGDNYARLGAPAGASVSADVASIKTDTGTTIPGRLPAALVSGRMDASVGAMAANVLTATAIAADAITDAKVAADVTIASVTGAVGSVTGAVGSVTGSVGSVVGAVGSVIGLTPTTIADATLNRDMSAVSDTNARSPLNALRFIRNKWDVAGTTLTVKKEDDITTAWTATVTATAGADPITGNDPA